MPGKRFRYRYGKHRVRITGVNPSAGTIFIQAPDGTETCVEYEKLQPIPQKSTRKKKRQQTGARRHQKGGPGARRARPRRQPARPRR